MKDLSHRPIMTLSEYRVKCARCPFKDMRDECKRAQKLKSMACCAAQPLYTIVTDMDIGELL